MKRKKREDKKGSIVLKELDLKYFNSPKRIKIENSTSPKTPPSLKSYVVIKEKQQSMVKKSKILSFLESILHLDLQNSLLTDIVFSEEGSSFTVVGRTKLDGTSKQLNHIIPVSFIKNLIDITIKNSKNPKLALKLLSQQLIVLAQSQEGFSITSEQLEKQEYSKIAKIAPSIFDRQITANSFNTMLFSPGKQSLLFKTPTKHKIAKKLYPLHNKIFISKAMELFAEALSSSDENTATIACEALARFIFIVCSKGKNISFASEGNTLHYEIRLYDDADDASQGNDKYSVVKSRELVDLDSDIISGCIRIVNCEGIRIKEIPKALSILNEIIKWHNLFEETTDDLLEKYNIQYNSIITLSNSTEDISPYNAKLTEKNYTTILYHHIAKQLYLAFDLKALEDVVFVPELKGDVKVYTSSKGKRTATYSIIDGEDYREMQINTATSFSDESFFRNKEKDLKILPQKIVELFIIGTMSFAEFATGFLKSKTKFLSTCFEKLISLAALDYCLTDESLEDFKSASLKLYSSWTSSNSQEDELQDTIISLSGNSNLSDFFDEN